jgi:virginiamycin B lyase
MKLGRITTTGTITEFAVPAAIGQPYVITVGPDGNFWITGPSGGNLVQADTTGNMSWISLPTLNAGPEFIVTGPDGNLWFTEYQANKIGRFALGGTHSVYMPMIFGSPVSPAPTLPATARSPQCC